LWKRGTASHLFDPPIRRDQPHPSRTHQSHPRKLRKKGIKDIKGRGKGGEQLSMNNGPSRTLWAKKRRLSEKG